MAEQEYITQANTRRRSQARLGLDRGHKYETIQQPYFFDYVSQQLIESTGSTRCATAG